MLLPFLISDLAAEDVGTCNTSRDVGLDGEAFISDTPLSRSRDAS